ncbi:MAG TPA: Nif3-like dinuclear metal center hexameric protein [Candidatus Krumholzibacterium sp.]|nr:Nif3-like dinuclear metal center hexameric protein [Candidatus Krumholzibacterium sp.]
MTPGGASRSGREVSRKTLTRFLDEKLEISSFRADSSLNGLQVEGRSRIGRVTLAVDACEESIRAAVRSRSGMLIVHHGLFWGSPVPVTGIMAKRISLLLGRGISLYAAHLPLDCHPEIGNNALLASSLGIDRTEKFGEYAGYVIGLCGSLPAPVSAAGFAAKVRRLTGAPVRTFRSGRDRIRKVGIVSGGGASLLKDAFEAGCDAMLTGETSHSAFHAAKEYGIDLFCAGHYATETFGIRAVGGLLEDRFGVEVRFADIPTGL